MFIIQSNEKCLFFRLKTPNPLFIRQGSFRGWIIGVISFIWGYIGAVLLLSLADIIVLQNQSLVGSQRPIFFKFCIRTKFLHFVISYNVLLLVRYWVFFNSFKIINIETVLIKQEYNRNKLFSLNFRFVPIIRERIGR